MIVATRIVHILGLPMLTLAVAGAAHAQSYPNKPVRIVTAAPGGGVDYTARVVGQGLAAKFGQSFVVENRGGAATIPAENVAGAAADGYTLLLHNNTIWTAPLFEKLPDYMANLTPVVLATRSPNLLVVHPSVAARSVKEFIALAKAKPGELNYASGPVGAANYLSAELFNFMAGVHLVRVGYKGGAPAMSDLMGGQVQVMFATVGSVIPHVKSGRLIALGVTGAEPTTLAPGVPTIAASGLPGYELIAIYGLFAPAKTPPAIIASLNQATRQLLEQADVKERLFTAGMEAGGGTPMDFDLAVKSDIARIARIVKTP
jgi:tripartite-type tricarboxylate transporter receptor subunit TctC